MNVSGSEEALLTVVIPALNREETLKRTLRSVSRQSLRPFNVVLVDNGSSDNTLATMQQWAKMADDDGIGVKVVSENKHGASAARNRGLVEVTTPYVMFFDSDDEMRPWHLERVVEYFVANPDSELMIFDACEIDSDGWTNDLTVTDSNLMRGHIYHSLVSTMRYAASSELVRSIGGWNEDLPVWNDLELGVRLLLKARDARVVHSAEAPVVVHQMEDSISSVSVLGRVEEYNRALEEMEANLRAFERADALRWVAVKRIVAGAQFYHAGDKTGARIIEAPVWRNCSGFKRRLALWLCSASVRLTGHGACAIAELLGV